MKKSIGIAMILLLLTGIMLNPMGCGKQVENGNNENSVTENGEAEKENLIKIGFSQVGAESDWRKANTESMKETFAAQNGYELIFSDAQQKQTNQITAIRNFIQREVDYIVLAPVTEDGWDTVLSEAKEAGIPVIIVDRMVNVEDESLFACWVGSDFKLEGDKVCQWLKEYSDSSDIEGENLNIVSIQGTIGASSQLGRSAGLNGAVAKYGWNLLEEAEGEYTQARAREVMSAMLKKYNNINVVYCENDNEAFGVIEAIEAAGKIPGEKIERGQIMVLSFDGVSKQAINLAKEGKISCIGECNPLHGPRVKKIIESLERGEVPDKFEYVTESVFSKLDKIKTITVNNETYPVTILGN